MNRRKYRARPLGFDVSDTSAWVGSFPDGPLIHLNGVSFEILMVLVESSDPLDAEDISGVLRTRVKGVPDDAASAVSTVLAEFERNGLVVAATDDIHAGEN